MQSTIPPPRNRVSRASAGSADSCPASSLRSGRGAARRVAQVVKGLSAEPLSRPQLEADKPFPNDRVFALAQPSAPIDTINPQCKEWPVRDADAGRGSGQGDNRTRSQRYPAHRASQGADRDLPQSGRRERSPAAGTFFLDAPAKLPAPPVLLRSRGGNFMDKPDNVISLINLATVRALEEFWRRPIDPFVSAPTF
jgi:GntR family transcriptional regulator/MocR family aminotransferase